MLRLSLESVWTCSKHNNDEGKPLYLRLFTSLQTPFDIDNHNAIPKESLPKIDIIFKNNETFYITIMRHNPLN